MGAAGAVTARLARPGRGRQWRGGCRRDTSVKALAMGRIVKWVGIVAAITVAVVAALAVAASRLDTEDRAFPATAPGHRVLTLPVAHRDVPLDVHAFYPTDVAGPMDWLGRNALFYGAAIRPDAAPAPGPHPVALLSHGSGGNAAALGWFAAALAREGWLVLAPNHPGTTSGDSVPERTPNLWERTADLSAVLDAAPGWNLGADVTRVAATGFSLGGAAALALTGARLSKPAFLAYCADHADELDCGWMLQAGVDLGAIDAARYEADLSDPRVTATIAVDPALGRAMVPASLAAIDVPVLILALGTPEAQPAGLRADDVAAAIPGGAYAALPGTHHFAFTAECAPLGRVVIGLSGEENICDDAGLRPRAEVHDDVLARVLPFLAAVR